MKQQQRDTTGLTHEQQLGAPAEKHSAASSATDLATN